VFVITKKVERRLNSREDRALQVSKLDFKIKEELLERLKKGTYGEIYNFDQTAFDQVIQTNEVEIEDLEDEYIADFEDYENDQFMRDDSDDSEHNPDDQPQDDQFDESQPKENLEEGDYFKMDDLEDLSSFFSSVPIEELKPPKSRPRSSKGKKHIEIEIEEEYDTNTNG